MSSGGPTFWRRWRAAVRNPAGWVGLVALAGFVLPLVVAWALILAGHHLNGSAVTIVVAVCLGWPVAWLMYPSYLEARKADTRGTGQTQAGSISVGPGSIVGFGQVTAGQLVVPQPMVEGPLLRLAPRAALLAGREELLTELHARLTGGEGPEPRTVALCGLGGTGKTSVAVEYAHRHLGEVGAAWQLAAEDPAVLAAGFAELAAQLGAQDLLGARDPVASVHRVLAGFPDGWLLIFDNVPDRASVERFLPPSGPGRVLITSQNPAWPPGQVLDVPVLSTEDAAEFLVNRTSDPDSRAAAELAAELAGLPLALEQAGAYIQAAADSLAGYLESFRQRRRELLARGEPAGYPGTLATTWALAFTRLEQAAPGAVGLLRRFAHRRPSRCGCCCNLGPGSPDGSGARWQRH